MTLVDETTGSSGLSFEEMKTLLKRHGFDDNDPLNQWLNAAMHDLEDEEDWPWLEAEPAEIEAEAGAGSIEVPENFSKVRIVRDITNLNVLEYYSFLKFNREIEDPTETSPSAQIYTLVDLNIIKIWPVLSSPATFEVTYQALTSDMSAAEDTPTTAGKAWPAQTCYPIVQRAAAMALQAENEEERSKVAQEQYEKGLERLKRKFTSRHLGDPEGVQDVMGYGSSGRMRRWR